MTGPASSPPPGRVGPAGDVLAGRPVAVVDVEGNGQSPPEIIEIAVLPTTGRLAGRRREWLVQPQRPISPIVTRTVHGIRNADVAHAPRWDQIADEVRAVLAGRILVAHHATVEYRVLSRQLPQWRPLLVLCTHRLARAVWPGQTSYTLTALITAAGIPPARLPAQQHRAGPDTERTWLLLLALLDSAPALTWDGLVRAAALPGTNAAEGTLW